MALVYGEDISCAVPPRKHDKRCIGQANSQLGIPKKNILRRRHIGRAEGLEVIRASGDFVKERDLSCAPT
jgi:hypothetical protein